MNGGGQRRGLCRVLAFMCVFKEKLQEITYEFLQEGS